MILSTNGSLIRTRGWACARVCLRSYESKRVHARVALAAASRMPKMGSEICRRYIVSGRVQGVFFRASTASVAHRLGVRGRASNEPDGTVKVLALGPQAAVEELGAWLRQGPPSAQVTEVQVSEERPQDWRQLSDFRTG